MQLAQRRIAGSLAVISERVPAILTVCEDADRLQPPINLDVGSDVPRVDDIGTVLVAEGDHGLRTGVVRMKRILNRGRVVFASEGGIANVEQALAKGLLERVLRELGGG